MCALSFNKGFFCVWVLVPLHWSKDVQDWEFLVDFSYDEYEVSFHVFFDDFCLNVNFTQY